MIALTIAHSDIRSKSFVAGIIKYITWSKEYFELLLFASSFSILKGSFIPVALALSRIFVCL